MIKNLPKIIIAVFVSLIVLLYNSYYDLGVFYFYAIIGFLIYDVVRTKKIQLLHIWNGAFLFIILSEVFVRDNMSLYKLEALKFLIIANNIVFIGYYFKRKRHFKLKQKKKEGSFSNRTNKSIGVLLILVVFLYVLYKYKYALVSYTLGRDIARHSIESNLLDSIFNSIELVLPAIIVYYFHFIKHKHIIVSFLVSLPIFIILVLIGTRFPLLFSVLGFVLTMNAVSVNSKSFKKYLLLGGVAIFLIGASTYMREVRLSSSKNQSTYYAEEKEAYKYVPTYLSQYMSPEGVLDMNSLMFEHFDNNSHLYGASSSFLFYFWIPRSVWPDKPKMLGYWLIREHRSGFGDAHNVSYGFTGELFADFGYFALIFTFFIGILLRVGEDFKDYVFHSESYSIILGAMLYPYVFFFVRSPLTSTINFLQ